MRLLLTFTLLLMLPLTANAQTMNQRFQIVSTDAATFLLDTQTGQTWVAMVVTADNGRKMSYWEPRAWFANWEAYNKEVEAFLKNNKRKE
jgi:hypothetical protein